MKNQKNDNEQDLSLFDGHEDLISDIDASSDETDEEAAYESTADETAEPTLAFDDNTQDDGEDPYYDEGEVVMTETEEYEPEEESDDNVPVDEESEENEDSESEEPFPAQEEKPEPTEMKPTQASNVEKPRRIDSLFDFIELFVFTLAAVFIITSFFFKYSNVVGDSMQHTLESGEKLVLSNFFYTPKPGDVVVIDDRSLEEPIVKRIIAVGGQRVKITADAIYVDGERLDEEYVYTKDYPKGKYQYSVTPCEALMDNIIGYEEGVYYEILVPENEIFFMGDHRNKSYDSRDIGTLSEDSVLGKAVIRFYPFDKFGKID